MAIEVVPYVPAMRAEWDSVVTHARNAIFQYYRAYIEHHEKAFEDRSFGLLVDGKLSAVFPASLTSSDHITSHGGLTFGGLAFLRELRGDVAIDCSSVLLDNLADHGIRKLTVRSMPAQFQSYPSSEFDYVVWRRGGSIVRRDLSSLLPLGRSLGLSKSRRQAIAKAEKRSVLVTPKVSIEEFHDLLSKVLEDRHATHPVHSVSELSVLAKAFPGQIGILGARLGDRLVAASMVYKYARAWHFQYLASSPDGRETGALDLIIYTVCEEAKSEGIEAVSFGTSTINAGRDVNAGLLWQKEGFGARSIVHDHIEICF